MSSVIARLGAVLGLDTKEFVKGIDAAQQKSKEFKQNLKDLHKTTEGLKTAFEVASAAFVGFAGHAINAANEIQDLANANETTTGKILELRHALSVSGGDADKVGTLFTSFTTAINNAAQGSDALRDSFKAIGISTHDLGFLSSDELRQKAIDGLAKIDDVTRRNALAMEMFGKAARNLDMKNFAATIEETAGHYKNQEEAIKAAAEAAEKMKQIFHDIETAALMAVKPVVDLFNKIPTEDRVEALTKAFQALGIAMAVGFGVTAVKGVMQLSGALRALTLTNPWLLALAAGGAAAAYFGIDKLLGGGADHGEAAPELNDDKNTQKRKLELSDRDKMILKYKTLIAEAKEFGKLEYLNIVTQEYWDKKSLELEGKKYMLSSQQYDNEKLSLDLAKQKYNILQNRDKKLEEAQKQLELAPPIEHSQAKKLYDEKTKWIIDNAEQEINSAQRISDVRQKNMDAEYERQRSWAAGWDEAFKQYNEAAERASDRGKEAFNMVMQSMDNALKTFVETGKLNFKSLVGSIIKDLIFMQLKAQATGLFKMGMSAIFGGGGGISSALSSFSMAASGGAIDRPTIVGENGAELFIPRTAGTIIPNGSWQQAAANMGNSGFTNNGTYIASMSAIDTQSATQFLASNKGTIWAAYQSANRSVPISR
jgi:lambda family phage tail tape measure protein